MCQEACVVEYDISKLEVSVSGISAEEANLLESYLFKNPAHKSLVLHDDCCTAVVQLSPRNDQAEPVYRELEITAYVRVLVHEIETHLNRRNIQVVEVQKKE